MPDSNAISPYDQPLPERPCQGSLYREIVALNSTPGGSGLEIDEWQLAYAVAMNQECDLSQDDALRRIPEIKKHDKLLPTVLLCPAYQAASFREGKHLEALGQVMENYNSDRFKNIKQNNNLRFHFLAAWPDLQVPELVVDFKHFFAVPMQVIREKYGSPKHHFARLRDLYREDLSHRFATYLARIGLPVPHHELGQSPAVQNV